MAISTPDKREEIVAAMPKVTMMLTQQDIDNANRIYAATQARSRAQAVSIALSLAWFIIEQKIKKQQVILRGPDGEDQRIIMPDLESLNDDSQYRDKLGTIIRSLAKPTI